MSEGRERRRERSIESVGKKTKRLFYLAEPPAIPFPIVDPSPQCLCDAPLSLSSQSIFGYSQGPFALSDEIAMRSQRASRRSATFSLSHPQDERVVSSDGPLRLPSDPAGAELETATEAAIGRGEKNRSHLSLALTPPISNLLYLSIFNTLVRTRIRKYDLLNSLF